VSSSFSFVEVPVSPSPSFCGSFVACATKSTRGRVLAFGGGSSALAFGGGFGYCTTNSIIIPFIWATMDDSNFLRSSNVAVVESMGDDGAGGTREGDPFLSASCSAIS
jgi:hypothetical protein